MGAGKGGGGERRWGGKGREAAGPLCRQNRRPAGAAVGGSGASLKGQRCSPPLLPSPARGRGGASAEGAAALGPRRGLQPLPESRRPPEAGGRAPPGGPRGGEGLAPSGSGLETVPLRILGGGGMGGPSVPPLNSSLRLLFHVPG